MNGLTRWTAIAIAGLAGMANAASVYDDDFQDGVVGSQWQSYADTSKLTLSETGGHLNVLSAMSDNSHADALYLSHFSLSTASDFTIQVDYHFPTATLPTPVPGSGGTLRTLGLDFGVGTDVTGYNSAAIGQGFASIKNPVTGVVSATAAGAVASRTSNSESDTALATNLTTGTFVISYNHAADQLTLSEVGGVSTTLSGLVQGTWNASSLMVSLGGRGDSEFSTVAGDAYLDNFTIVSGTVVPEPAMLGMALLGLIALRRRR